MLQKRGILLFLALFAQYSLLPYSGGQKKPAWWEIQINLAAEGEYKVEQEDTSYTGNYSFTIVWTGSMETDDEDYIIYHENCELLRWEAREKKTSDSSPQVKSTADFKEKPYFHFNYLFREGKNLSFDFTIDEFPVPQEETSSPLHLLMPSSRSIFVTHLGKSYESSIIKGSNSISIEEKDIYISRVEKEFAWTWKDQKWIPEQKVPTRLTNLHKVVVKVSITPHFE